MPTTTVNQVADWFILSSREVGDTITNLKLQKLAYYAQAWHLAIHGERLVPESFQAWVHGPVCPPLYQRFKQYRWDPISEEIAAPQIGTAVVDHLDEVMEVYGGLTAWDLERLTHSETPWIAARGGIPPEQNSEAEISDEAMLRFYKPKADVQGE